MHANGKKVAGGGMFLAEDVSFQEVFTPEDFTSQQKDIARAAEDFINHPRGVSFINNRLLVSSIYFWFMEDFGGTESGIIEHLRRYLNSGNLKKLDIVQKKIRHQYDWSLNE